MGHIKVFLLELIRLDGRGEHQTLQACSGCSMDEPHYRCRDCLGSSFLCKSCIIKSHSANPFHHIEVCVFIHNLSLNQLNIYFKTLEWQILWTWHFQIFGRAHTTQTCHWWTLPFTHTCVQWFFHRYRYQWHTWHRVGFLWMWTRYCISTTASLLPLSCHSSKSQHCRNLSHSSSLSTPKLWIKMFGLWILSNTCPWVW